MIIRWRHLISEIAPSCQMVWFDSAASHRVCIGELCKACAYLDVLLCGSPSIAFPTGPFLPPSAEVLSSPPETGTGISMTHGMAYGHAGEGAPRP